MSHWTLDIFVLDGLGGLGNVLGGGRKEKEVNRLHEAIVPYIAENLRPYVTRPPVRSRGD